MWIWEYKQFTSPEAVADFLQSVKCPYDWVKVTPSVVGHLNIYTVFHATFKYPALER